MSDSSVTNEGSESQAIILSSSRSPPKGREISPPTIPIPKPKLLSFAPDTAYVIRDAVRHADFLARQEHLREETKREQAIERGELIIHKMVPRNEFPDGWEPRAPVPSLGLTSLITPASLQPSGVFVRPTRRPRVFVRPTRRPRTKRRKVVISPTSMAEPPSQSPIPPLMPPNPPPLLPLPPPISSDSFDVSLVSPSSSSVPTSSVPCQLSATAVTFVPAAVKAKKSSYFEQFAVVRKVIEEAMSKRTFSFSQFRRHQRQSTMFVNDSAVPTPASSMKVREMFDAEFCGCGDEPLPEIETALNLDSMDKYHVMSCVDCSTEGKILDECYSSKLRRCIPCGFKPQGLRL